MCKAKVFIIGATLLALVLIPSIIGLSCGTKPAQAPTSPPVSTESEIPANFTTYTDESGLFSISYPSDWEIETIVKSLKSAKEAISSLKANTIFLAGRRMGKGYEPSINIIVEPVLAGISTPDQMVDVDLQEMNKIISDYRELSRIKTTIDGRDATIGHFEGTPPSAHKCHYLVSITLAVKTYWQVVCSSYIEDYAVYENDFNTIVRSLRISD